MRKLKGFDYICKAVKYISENRTMKMCRVYDLIAKDSGATWSRVEKAIRHALSKADKDSEAYKKYIGIKETTNSAILYTLAVRLKED